jgi:formate dehydrogenase assembly factor FdhD
MAESVAVWRALAGLGETMSQLVESPVGLAALMMGFILSAGALRAISVLIDSDQRGRYVSFV